MRRDKGAKIVRGRRVRNYVFQVVNININSVAYLRRERERLEDETLYHEFFVPETRGFYVTTRSFPGFYAEHKTADLRTTRVPKSIAGHKVREKRGLEKSARCLHRVFSVQRSSE